MHEAKHRIRKCRQVFIAQVNREPATLCGDEEGVKGRKTQPKVFTHSMAQLINNIRQYMSYKIDKCWYRLPKVSASEPYFPAKLQDRGIGVTFGTMSDQKFREKNYMSAKACARLQITFH